MNVPSKITWYVDNSKSWQDSLYPSLVKKIQKSDAHFSDIFRVDVEDLTPQSYLTKFFPLYKTQIATKSTYNLDLNTQKNYILTRIDDGLSKTKLASVYMKKNNIFIGGVIFSVWKDKITIAHRVFDREIGKKFKQVTTIDFWFESKFREITHSIPVPVITHGSDTHPFSEGIGLALFKMQVGGLAGVSLKKYDPTFLDVDEIKIKKKTTLVFTSMRKNLYTQTTVFVGDDGNPSMLNALKKILLWNKTKSRYIPLT